MTKIFDFWPGYIVDEEFMHGSFQGYSLIHHPDYVPRCGSCGQHVKQIYDTRPRNIRDAPIFGVPVLLKVAFYRVDCPTCGIRTEAHKWIEVGRRLTRRFETLISDLLHRQIAIKHVAGHYQLHWDTIKDIDRRRMSSILAMNPIDFENLRHLMMDEFAIARGHRYATIVANAVTGRVLWVGEGNSRENVRPFFTDFLGDHCKRIEAVAMDMNASFDLEVRKHCLQAEVVYDLFHVVARYAREVIDAVRVDTANQLRGDKVARKVVKTSKWLLLKNPENLNAGQAVKLNEVLAANTPLMTVYVAKDMLKEIWVARTLNEAATAWRAFVAFAKESGIACLKHFAKKLTVYRRGILSHSLFRLGTSRLEGMNNKVKVIKRVAYGFRDFEYFSLKIKSSFHLNP
jgi:transposase